MGAAFNFFTGLEKRAPIILEIWLNGCFELFLIPKKFLKYLYQVVYLFFLNNFLYLFNKIFII